LVTRFVDRLRRLCGFGGVLSIRRNTSSRFFASASEVLAMAERSFANLLALPKEYYAAIGEVIFRWAQLEYQIQEIIWRAMGIDNKQGRTLTIGMDTKTLSAILRNLPKRWLTTARDKQRANSIALRLRRLGKFRNALAHGSWQFPEGGNKIDAWLHYMKENRLMPTAKKHTVQEIQDHANKLRRLNEKAQDFIYDLDMREADMAA
jgi:hypothetical protein